MPDAGALIAGPRTSAQGPRAGAGTTNYLWQVCARLLNKRPHGGANMMTPWVKIIKPALIYLNCGHRNSCRPDIFIRIDFGPNL